MVNFPEGYLAYIILYVVGLILANIVPFILTRFDSNRTEENNQLQEAKANMLHLRKIVMCIMADQAAQPYDAKLRALEEKLHFSKDNVIAAEDVQIRDLLLQLQENIANPEFDSEQLMQDITKLIDRRNIMA